ncbi:hypothetical protein BaRGS_00034517 [Batillaria attramentaria]|uniref:Uncharacterized protein n=1 Tax=Batillaria attramentaria TaxID=370345 RepID=A0ABD0JHN9_9CAEN
MMAAAAWTWQLLLVVLLAGTAINGCGECMSTALKAEAALGDNASSLAKCNILGNALKCMRNFRKDITCNETIKITQNQYDENNCNTVLLPAKSCGVPPRTSLPLLCAALTLSFGFLVFNFCKY